MNEERAREIVREKVIFPAIAIANTAKQTEETVAKKSVCPQTVATIHQYEERMIAIHSQCQQELPSMSQQDCPELEQRSFSQLLLSGGPSNPRVSPKESEHPISLHSARSTKCNPFVISQISPMRS